MLARDRVRLDSISCKACGRVAVCVLRVTCSFGAMSQPSHALSRFALSPTALPDPSQTLPPVTVLLLFAFIAFIVFRVDRVRRVNRVDRDELARRRHRARCRLFILQVTP